MDRKTKAKRARRVARLQMLNRLACLLYAQASMEFALAPPWASLTDDQREPWRRQVLDAVAGRHKAFEFHHPDAPAPQLHDEENVLDTEFDGEE